jgi:hypothetical protein
MRQAQIRALDAMGYAISKTVQYRGVESLSLKDPSGFEYLALASKPFGLAWPQLLVQLQSLGLEVRAIQVANKVMLLVPEDQSHKHSIGNAHQTSRVIRKSEVHLAGKGFVATSVPKKVSLRALIGPLAISLALMFAVPFLEQDQEPIEDLVASPGCLLDLPATELDAALSELLRGLDPKNQTQIQSERGLIKIVVLDSIGATSQLAVSVSCSDGQAIQQEYRYDFVQGGPLSRIALD